MIKVKAKTDNSPLIANGGQLMLELLSIEMIGYAAGVNGTVNTFFLMIVAHVRKPHLIQNMIITKTRKPNVTIRKKQN